MGMKVVSILIVSKRGYDVEYRMTRLSCPHQQPPPNGHQAIFGIIKGRLLGVDCISGQPVTDTHYIENTLGQAQKSQRGSENSGECKDD